MTLFSQIEECEDNIFKKVIDKFFNGKFDDSTLLLLAKGNNKEVSVIDTSVKEIQLSEAILDTIFFSDIIYAEMADGGAEGCAGQIMFYTIEEEQLVLYKTNLSEDENLYKKHRDCYQVIKMRVYIKKH